MVSVNKVKKERTCENPNIFNIKLQVHLVAASMRHIFCHLYKSLVWCSRAQKTEDSQLLLHETSG